LTLIATSTGVIMRQFEGSCDMANELFSLVQALQVLCLYRSVWGIAIVIKYTKTARSAGNTARARRTTD